MFDGILIATDDSPSMKSALEYTANIFPSSNYHLINVINTSDRSIPQTPLMRSKLEEISRETIDHGKNILYSMGISKVNTAIPEGVPSKEIMRYVEEHDIDLLVLATHSKVGSQEIHIGDTALHSLQLTHIPSLIFSCQCKSKVPKSIFNPTTFSTYSVEATFLALELASFFGADLTTYHIGKADPGEELDEVRRMAKDKSVDFRVVVDRDATDEKLVKESNKYDFIVGSRGRGGLLYKFRHLIPQLALSDLEKELITGSPIPFLMVGD